MAPAQPLRRRPSTLDEVNSGAQPDEEEDVSNGPLSQQAVGGSSDKAADTIVCVHATAPSANAAPPAPPPGTDGSFEAEMYAWGSQV